MNKIIIGGACASVLLMSACSSISDNLGFSDTKKVQTSTDPARSAVGTPSLEKLTVGDVLQRGGRQLTAAQLKNIAGGSAFEGVGNDNAWRSQLATDGTMRGESLDKSKNKSQFQGRWWIDEAERLCMVNETAGTTPDCSYLYQLQGSYYASPMNTREAPVSMRNLFK